MEKILIDSSVLLGHLEGNLPCRQFIQKLLLSGREPALSVMVLNGLDLPDEIEKIVSELLDLFDIISVTPAVVKTANRIEKSLQNSSINVTILSTEQIFAAATALNEGYTLVTLPDFVALYSENPALSDLFVFAVPNL